MLVLSFFKTVQSDSEINMKLLFLIACFLSALLFAALASSAPLSLKPEELQKMRAYKAEIERLLFDASESQRAATAKKLGIETLQKEIAAAELEVNTSKEKRQKLEAAESQDPGSINPERLAQLRRQSDAAFDKKRQLLVQAKQAESDLNQFEQNYSQKTADAALVQKNFDKHLNVLTEQVLSLRKAEYLKPRSIESTGVVPCGNMPVKECKEKSLLEAERQAIEKGSVIVVDSITEINNSTLTKDQIRSAARGRVSSREIIEARLVSDDTAFQTKIRAMLTPGLADELLTEMRAAARLDVETQISSGVNSAVAANTAEPTKVSREEKLPDTNLPPTNSAESARPAYQAPKKPVPVIVTF